MAFKYNTEKYILEAIKIHGDKYDYSKTIYKSTKEKIIIICKIHGEFQQRPDNHLFGQSCKKCGLINMSNLQIKNNSKVFIEKAQKIHGNKYDYSQSNYTGSKQLITIICKNHGKFEQLATSHLTGKGCHKCNNLISKDQLELLNYLKSLNIENIIISDRKILNGKELDFYLPDYNLAIEFNGLYWHSDNFKSKNYHLNKTNLCLEQNINLIHIFEDEWIYKKDIIKSYFSNLFNKNINKIYGRHTKINSINENDFKKFIKNNSLYDFKKSDIYLGLYYKKYLVSVISFKKIFNVNYELNQYCSIKFVNVLGGFSKLLKYFELKYKPEKIIISVNKRINNIKLLEKLNFKITEETKPNYINVYQDQRIDDDNFPRIYDCGNIILEKTIKIYGKENK